MAKNEIKSRFVFTRARVCVSGDVTTSGPDTFDLRSDEHFFRSRAGASSHYVCTTTFLVSRLPSISNKTHIRPFHLSEHGSWDGGSGWLTATNEIGSWLVSCYTPNNSRITKLTRARTI